MIDFKTDPLCMYIDHQRRAAGLCPIFGEVGKMPEQKMKNCSRCPSHLVIPDPDPHDRVCDDDVAIVCTLEKNPRQDPESIHLSDRSQYRLVAVAVRPYNVAKEDGAPKWCPLNKNV